jgi:cation:H+ antiporter
VSLVFLADLVHGGGPVLNDVGAFAALGAILGMIVTLVYLAGIIERRNAVIWRIGPDSVLVLLLYCGGLILLYRVEGS